MSNIHNSHPLLSVWRHSTSLHLSCLEVHFNIIPLSTCVCVCCNSPKSPPPKKFRVRILPLSHACFIPSPYDSTWFNQPNDIQRRASSSLSSTNIFLSTLRLSSAHFVSYQAPHQYKKTQNFHFYASLFYFAPFLSSKKKDRISLKEWKLANRVCLSVNFLLCIT